MPKMLAKPNSLLEIDTQISDAVTDAGPGIQLVYKTNTGAPEAIWIIPLDTITSFFFHEYESLERALIYRFYDAGDRVLEAGTGLGITGLSILRTGAYLVSADPQERNVLHAAYVFGLNGFTGVPMLHAAITSRDGKATLTIDRMNWDATLLDTGLKSTNVQIVQCVGVNSVIREHKLNAIHLDVEGTEVNILEALDLVPINKVSLEVHPSMIGEQAYDDIIVPKLEDAGFEMIVEDGMNMNYPTQNFVVGWERK